MLAEVLVSNCSTVDGHVLTIVIVKVHFCMARCLNLTPTPEQKAKVNNNNK